MPELTIAEIKSIREYIELIETALAGGNKTPWYRGCSGDNYDLLPGLYRHPTIADAEGLKKLELQIQSRFKRRAVPYTPTPLGDAWERLFLAQHFGVPTRLLDWTENPFVALYFALAWKPVQKERDGIVWILDPVAWNQYVLRQASYEGGALTIDDEDVKGYQTPPAGPTRKDAVALYGSHNSPRIVAQRGVFTIFGLNTEPMEQTYQTQDFPKDCLVKVVVPAASAESLRERLFAIGVTDSGIMPDLDGLAREIKRELRFKL